MNKFLKFIVGLVLYVAAVLVQAGFITFGWNTFIVPVTGFIPIGFIFSIPFVILIKSITGTYMTSVKSGEEINIDFKSFCVRTIQSMLLNGMWWLIIFLFSLAV